jgi:hypothetical protein
MGLLTGRNVGTKARNDGRRKVYKCTVHGNAQPCSKCAIVDKEAAKRGTGPKPCPKCGKTMRGGVCPGAFC